MSFRHGQNDCPSRIHDAGRQRMDKRERRIEAGADCNRDVIASQSTRCLYICVSMLHRVACLPARSTNCRMDVYAE